MQIMRVKSHVHHRPRPLPLEKPPLEGPPLPLPPGPPLPLGGGDLGRSASMRSVHPVVSCPELK